MKAIDIIRNSGTVEEIKKDAAGSWQSTGRQKNNLHIHLPPNFSAFETVRQVVEMAVKEGVRVLGVTNYYYHDVYEDYAALAREYGIFPLFGLEIISQIDDLTAKGVRINDPGNPGRMYICGKGITGFSQLTASADKMMERIRNADRARMKIMIDRLSRIFSERGLAVDVSDADIIKMVARRHGSREDRIVLQERHVAQAFQEIIFSRIGQDQRAEVVGRILGTASKAGPDDAVKLQGEIRSHLMKAGKPAFVVENFVTFEEARHLVLEMGGIPCYPTLADGSSVLCEYEEDLPRLIKTLKSLGFTMAEFIPIRNKPDVLVRYVSEMRKAGLVVVAGTEHNTLDLLPIDPKCVGGIEVPDEIKDIFWEGACVVAGHIFMVSHGECGFVDGRGRPNPAYSSDSERIEYFRKIGESVICRYMAEK